MVTAPKKPVQNKSNSKPNSKKAPMPMGLKIGLIIGAIILVCVVGMGLIGLIFAGSIYNYFTQNGNIKVDEKSGTVEISSEDGKQTFSTKSDLPDNYPSDIPVYPNATVTSAITNGEAGSLVTWKSSDSVEDVSNYFEKELADQGWNKIEGETSFFGQGVGHAEKSGRTLSYVITSTTEDGQQMTSIAVTNENQQ
jgi:hypothetical protein